MKYRMKKIMAAVLCLAVLAGLTACGGNNKAEQTAASTASVAPESSESSAQSEKRLRMQGGVTDTMNPGNANSNDSVFMIQCLARLYRNWYDESMINVRAFGPELAASEPVQTDSEGCVWEIPVREDACWADGKAITADTFLYSFRMAASPLLKNRAADYFNTNFEVKGLMTYVQGGCGWEEVGLKVLPGNKLQLTTVHPTTALMVMKTFSTNQMCPVDPELYEACLSQDGTVCSYGTSVETANFCGAFLCDKWEKGSVMVMKKNPRYLYADRVKLSEIDCLETGDATMEMYMRGEVDWVIVDNAEAAAYQDSPDFFSSPYRRIYFLEINGGTTYYESENGQLKEVRRCGVQELPDPILADLNFRKALWYAIDRETIAKRVACTPANFFIPYTSMLGIDGTVRFRDTEAAKAYTQPMSASYDPELALSYLDKALAAYGREKLSFTLNHQPDSVQDTVVEYLQEAFRTVFDGKLTLELNTVNSCSAVMTAWKDSPRGYELSLSTWAKSAGDTSPKAVMDCWSTSYFGKTYGSFGVKRLEELAWSQAEDASVLSDPARNAEVAAEMEKLAMDNVLSVPILQSAFCYLVNEKILVPDYMGDDPSVWMIFLLDLAE